MRPITMAIVGVGKIASSQHAPTIARDTRFRLAATASEAGSFSGVPAFGSLEALLRDGPAIDAVAICTPPQSHELLARQAIAAGLHVLLEKPPAITALGLEGLKRDAAARGTTLFAAWHSRYTPGMDAGRSWLAAHRLTAGRIVWREDVRRWHPGQMWLWEPGGLGVFDSGINALSMISGLTAAPPSVLEAHFDVPLNAHTPIGAKVKLQLCGAPVDIDLDFRQQGPQTWNIDLEAEGGHTLALNMGGTSLETEPAGDTNTLAAEYARLYGQFAQLVADRASDADGVPLQLVADAFMVARIRRVEAFNY